MLRSLVALSGLVLVAGCVGTGPATGPAYYAPLPYSGVDPAPFMRNAEPQPPRNATCYSVGMYMNCTAY